MIHQASFSADIDTALNRYVARAPFYLGTASIIALVGSATILYGHLTNDEAQIAVLAFLAPLHGIVAIGTSVSLRDTRLALQTIVARALRKWPELLVCQFITTFIGTMAILSLLDNSWESAIALIPVSIAWGALSLSDVIVAVDEPEVSANFFLSLLFRMRFLGKAIGTAFGFAFRLQSLNRMALLAIIQVPGALLQLLVLHQIELRHLAVNEVLSAFLISCFADGLYEAIFTNTLQRLRSA